MSSASFIGCEVLTEYGWGVVREMASSSSSNRIVIDLEGFEGWNSRSSPALYSYAGERAFVAHSQSKLGSCVQTAHGMGVLIDYKRGEDEHIVRIIPSPSESGEEKEKGVEGPLLNLKREDMLGEVANFNGFSQDYLTALPVIEAIYAAMPDLDSGLLNQHPFEFFVTILMQVMNTSDFFPGLVKSGEGGSADKD